jgi:hypothetical protein
LLLAEKLAQLMALLQELVDRLREEAPAPAG